MDDVVIVVSFVAEQLDTTDELIAGVAFLEARVALVVRLARKVRVVGHGALLRQHRY